MADFEIYEDPPEQEVENESPYITEEVTRGAWVTYAKTDPVNVKAVYSSAQSMFTKDQGQLDTCLTASMWRTLKIGHGLAVENMRANHDIPPEIAGFARLGVDGFVHLFFDIVDDEQALRYYNMFGRTLTTCYIDTQTDNFVLEQRQISKYNLSKHIPLLKSWMRICGHDMYGVINIYMLSRKDEARHRFWLPIGYGRLRHDEKLFPDDDFGEWEWSWI